MIPDPQAVPNDGVVTRHQVAKFFGISTRSVDQMVARGKLRKIKLGSTTRFKAIDVRNLLH